MRPFPLPLFVLALSLVGCASARPSLRAELEPMALADRAEVSPPPVLTENPFRRDRVGSVSEEDLRRILASPTFLEEDARVGVVTVRSSYAPDTDLPLPAVPAALVDALDASGEFELVCEVSTDFPTDGGLSGLRELAARYRTEYLLIYRHRFVDRAWLNGWAWGYATLIGTLFLPGDSLEAAGVLEATLFDVRTGTILFTVFERVSSSKKSNPFHHDLEFSALKRRMLEEATSKLSGQVLSRLGRLVAARPKETDAMRAAGPALP